MLDGTAIASPFVYGEFAKEYIQGSKCGMGDIEGS